MELTNGSPVLISYRSSVLDRGQLWCRFTVNFTFTPFHLPDNYLKTAPWFWNGWKCICLSSLFLISSLITLWSENTFSLILVALCLGRLCFITWGHLGMWSMDILKDMKKGAFCYSINVDQGLLVDLRLLFYIVFMNFWGTGAGWQRVGGGGEKE